MRRVVVVFAILTQAAAAAAAGVIEGHVYVDVDRSGSFSTPDSVVPGVLVGFETDLFVTTNEQGYFSLEAPKRDGLVWVRTPEGYRPNPVWGEVKKGAADQTIDLALTPSLDTGSFVFVVASDTHIGKEEYGKAGSFDAAALWLSLDQALDLEPKPNFFVVTGDITNRELPAELEAVASIIRQIDVPFVPVAGNHDWVDRGRGYRRVFGPASYSFDAGGVHFVVLNNSKWEDPGLEFLRLDLAHVDPGRPVVAFMHRPPVDDVLNELERAGVNALFTGHWHGNRITSHGDLLQINTEPLVRGGIDLTPAGYRIVTIRDGALSIVHRTVVEQPVATVVYPRVDDCVEPGPVSLLASVTGSAAGPQAVAAWSGGQPVPLEFTGGWTLAGTLPAIDQGSHALRLTVKAGARLRFARDFTVSVCAKPRPAAEMTEWPQLQGGPQHLGSTASRIEPPLSTLWARHVGGYLQGGSPVIAGGRLLVSVVDLVDGSAGGVLALDSRTGAELWRYVTGRAVRSAPAVAGGIAVVAGNDGVIHALDVATGTVRWQHDLGVGLDDNLAALYASPTIADRVVHIGAIGRFAALDLETGRPLWIQRPAPRMKDFASYSSAAVADGVVVAGLGGDGVPVWDAVTGRQRRRIPEPAATGVNASPLIVNGTLYLVNSSTEVHAIDLATGVQRWRGSCTSTAPRSAWR
jgi:outer membrane protein assembly factor BamB/predicted phosphodiesterase